MKKDGIYLLDLSGSMSDDNFKEAFSVVEKTHKDYDRCALIGFDYHAYLIIPLGGNILQWPPPNKLPGHGGTCAKLAFKMAQELSPTAQIHVIGDGMMPDDNWAEMKRLNAKFTTIGSPYLWVEDMVFKYNISRS